MTASATSPRVISQTRKKLTVIHQMRKRKAELQDELAKVTEEVNKTEIEIEEKEEEFRRTKQKALQEVYSTRLEQQKTLKEMKSSLEGLQLKIPFLKKETCDLVESCMQEKVNIQEYMNLLGEKEKKLEELKQILQVKRETFRELEDEKARMEVTFGKELEKAKTDKLHKIQRDNRSFELYMKEKIEDYEAKRENIEKYLTRVKEERKCLQSTIELYSERAALLEEKKQLLIKDYHCLLSSELQPSDDLFGETLGGATRRRSQELEDQSRTEGFESNEAEQNEPSERLIEPEAEGDPCFAHVAGSYSDLRVPLEDIVE